ncbi:hypothetical protein ABPG77_003779 [Micractinium sp. CCAP 211/92]
MWNGLRTQEALEGGVFSRKEPLLVGTEDNPKPYDAKVPERDAYMGKQFSTQAPRPLFDPTCKPLFNGETYRDRLPYNELQPNKPSKGFMTSDFSKRDEFSLTLRAEQHRQQIKHEARLHQLADAKLATLPGSSAKGLAPAAAAPSQKEAPLLFDLVYAGDAGLCIKAKRDTRNPTVLSRERCNGAWKTTNSIAQAAPLSAGPCPQGSAMQKPAVGT